jgi:hypothetical protein
VKINGEDVELVTDFATLRSGMIVWVTACGGCQGFHRVILIKHTPWPVLFHPPGTKAWLFLPTVHGLDRLVVAPSAVSNGIVFRVVDGFSQSSGHKEHIGTKPNARVRA